MPPPDDEGRRPGLLVGLARSQNLGINLSELLAVEQSESSSPEAAGVNPRTVLMAGAPFFIPRFFFLAALPARCGALTVTSRWTGIPLCPARGGSRVVAVLNPDVLLRGGAVMLGHRV